MKSIGDIYKDIKNRFFQKTQIDVERGSAIDMFLLSSSEMILNAELEIENNKTPQIYTSLSGKRLDDMAILCGIYRKENESDSSFMSRLLNWNISNKASNLSSIEDKLTNLKFASHASFIPNTAGCGTASIYIIPKVMNDESNKNAIEEVKSIISDVVSPGLYIQYIIPTIKEVRLVLVLKSEDGDIDSIKNNISDKILNYVNGIAPGSSLELGEINKIGINEPNVDYFIVSSISIDGKEVGDTEIVQGVETKLITNKDNIIWMEVQ